MILQKVRNLYGYHLDSRTPLRRINEMPRMYGKLFLVAELLVLLVDDSTGLYGKVNLTKFFESQSRSDLPVLRDLSSYLSEEYENDEEPEKPEDFRQLDRQNRNLIPEYRNLCETVTRRIQFNDENYEYQPPHYHEVYCKSYSFLDRASERTTRSSSKQKCAYPVFHCVQRSRTLFLVRRAWNSDCWEPFTKEIASGCDCMWPVSLLGDITAHY